MMEAFHFLIAKSKMENSGQEMQLTGIQTFDSLFSPLGVSVSNFLIQKSSWHFNWNFMNFSLFVLPVLLSSSVNVNFECRLNG